LEIVVDSAGLNKRERAAVTVSGIIPDIDSFGIVVEQLTKNSENPQLWIWFLPDWIGSLFSPFRTVLEKLERMRS
jgi:hypothetical protein